MQSPTRTAGSSRATWCAAEHKEMACRWIRQGCIISLVARKHKEMACRWVRQGLIISLVARSARHGTAGGRAVEAGWCARCRRAR